MSNERVELILNNVTFGVLNRINASLSNYLKIDDYVYKKNTHSIIINNIEVLEGCELFLNHDYLEALEQNIFIPIENTHYLLVEFHCYMKLPLMYNHYQV